MLTRTKRTLITNLLGIGLLIAGTIATPVNAGDGHHRKNVFHDYGRVIEVKPKFRIVTKRVPHRVCDVQRGRYQQHLSHQYSHRNPQRRIDSVFVKGTIHGAIGREVSLTANNNHSQRSASVLHRHQRADTRRWHRVNSSDRHGHHRQHRRPHCSTTEHVQRIRKPDGYLVTYRFRGQTFRAHTDYHPGARIPVKVAVSAGR